MASWIYWVKQERPLFRKGDWTVKLGEMLIAFHKDRQSAVDEAISEAERTSILGRQTEVWVDDGHGFLLAKAFKASKPPVEDEEEGEDFDGNPEDGDNAVLI
jgi:hypothetical protein